MLKTEDLKTPYLKSEDSKYAFICWEPPKSLPVMENVIRNSIVTYYLRVIGGC